MPLRPRLLIVEDDPLARRNLEHILTRGDQYQVESVGGGLEALQRLAQKPYDLVLTDLRMDQVDGMQVLEEVKKLYPSTEVIMLTAFASVDSAIEAMKRGAFHYISKPYKIDEVRAQVNHALENKKLKEEVQELKRNLRAREGFDFIIGQHPQIQELKKTIQQIAPTDCNVLIVGQTGTGKELFARAIHQASARTEDRFVAFNCAAFTEELLASELFGHQKGAFTGAVAIKPGLFELADGGTIFLDEVGDMPASMQVKLLRVIQEKVITRVGGTEEIEVDVRLVAATNQDLKQLVEEGQFRSDLYYRLNVVCLELPALKEHRDDIPLLANHFLNKYAARQNKAILDIAPETMALLMDYDFPGNIRELENLIERAVTLSRGQTISPTDLPEEVRRKGLTVGPEDQTNLLNLEEVECQHIKQILLRTGGNKTRAAEILGIDRVSLWRKIKKYGLEN
ncbi:MAG: sigma-54-dependent Fis family transcriptional regulator [Deltaproteobacteria bacterium]|nr:sigma-54-dependent Fis family transcriptional regulator [Deltaproteobacteria bacterium]